MTGVIWRESEWYVLTTHIPKISSLPCLGIILSIAVVLRDPLFRLSIVSYLHWLNKLHMPLWWEEACSFCITGEELCAQVFRDCSVFLILALLIHMLETLDIKIRVIILCANMCDLSFPPRVYPHLPFPAIYPFPLLVLLFAPWSLTSFFLLLGFSLSCSSTSSSSPSFPFSPPGPPHPLSPLCFQLSGIASCIISPSLVSSISRHEIMVAGYRKESVWCAV